MWSDSDMKSNNFDAMRFSMAMVVIFSHSFTLLSGLDHDDEPLRRLNGGRLSLGELAVNVFFIISGFLITMSWERSRPFAYLKKRVLRIVPGFWVACLVGIFLVAPFFVSSPRNLFNKNAVIEVLKTLMTLSRYSPNGVFAHNPIPN